MSAPPPAPLTLVPFPSPDCTSASVARDLGGFPSVHTPPNDSLSGPFHPLHLLPDYEEDLIRAVDGWPTLGMLDFIEYQLHDAAATDDRLVHLAQFHVERCLPGYDSAPPSPSPLLSPGPVTPYTPPPPAWWTPDDPPSSPVDSHTAVATSTILLPPTLRPSPVHGMFSTSPEGRAIFMPRVVS